MKKLLLIVCLSFLVGCATTPPWEAAEDTEEDQKLSELTELDSGNPPANSDYMYIVDDEGTDASRKINVENLVRAGAMIATKSAGYTVGTDDVMEKYGGIIYLTSSATVTAPANPEEGMSFTVIAIGAVTATIDPNGTDNITLDGATGTNGVTIVGGGSAGDQATCFYYDADTWACQTNGWSTGS